MLYCRMLLRSSHKTDIENLKNRVFVLSVIKFPCILTKKWKKLNVLQNFYRCTVHSDIHTVYLPTDAHLVKLWFKITLKLDGCYMFRSTTIIRELVIEPG